MSDLCVGTCFAIDDDSGGCFATILHSSSGCFAAVVMIVAECCGRMLSHCVCSELVVCLGSHDINVKVYIPRDQW